MMPPFGRARRALRALVGLAAALGMMLGAIAGPPKVEVLRADSAVVEAPPPGAALSLPLDEGAGTVTADATGNGNTGTLLNGPAWTAGKSGGAISFDGIDDTLYIAKASSLNTVTTAVTVATWVYRSSTQPGIVSVLSRQVGNTYYEHFYLGFEDGKCRWFVNTSSGYSDFTIGGASALGQWIHLAGTYDGADVKLYVNGVLQFSTPHSGTFASDVTGLTVGASHNDGAHAPTEGFNGRADEVNVYAQALTAQEILQVYQSTGGTVDAPPSVAVTAPAAGTSVQATFTATASASDDTGVAGVQFLVDGFAAGAEDTTAPYSASIDTTQFPEGQHSLTALARDTSGNLTGSAAVSVVFDNIALMPLGDSYTYGYVATSSSNNDDGGYRRYLWQKLRANGIVNVNFVGSLVTGIAGIDRDHEGHGGWRIDEVDGSIAGWVAATPPDVILLLLGNNDIILGATPTVALNRMSALLDKIHGLRPTAKLILSNLPGTRPNSDFPMVTPAYVAEFNSGLTSLVSNRAGQGWNISLVDLWAILSHAGGSSDFSADGMHLSPGGYSKFADLWYSALYPGPVDGTPPSTPTGLSAVPVSASQIDLSWNPANDNVGVTGYQVIRNGVSIATTSQTTYQSAGLLANTTYAYTIRAYDAAGNQSPATSAVSATTQAAAAGPLVRLALDEGAGTTAADASGNGNNATLQNGPAWTAGKAGGALNFDGLDDTLYVGSATSLNSVTGGLTVAAWTYRSSNQPGYVSVVSREVGTAYYEHYYLGFADGSYRWFVNTTGGYSNTGIGNAAPLGQWVHVVGTYDGANVKFYVNGALQFTLPHSGAFSTDTTGVTIGASHNDASHQPGEGFRGAIDEVNLYARALTDQEVLQLYQATAGSPDGTPPTVSLSAPAEGATVSGNAVPVSAGAADNVAVAGVQFKLDGVNLGAEDTSAPYTINWNTTSASNGAHTLTAVARDPSNNTTTSSGVTVTVANAAFDFSLATAGAKSVARGSSVTNAITSTLTSGSTQAVTYSVSGLPTGASGSFSPASCSPTCTATLTIQTTASTPLAVSAVTVTGTAGSLVRTASFNLTVTAFVDTTPPSTPGKPAATVVSSSSINLSWAGSTDNVGVVGYRVYRNGVLIASTVGTTFQNTGLAANTPYSYRVSAYDAANNESSLSTATSAKTRK
jgi:lysophospholipase L1-like esterase/chitodextrinase